MAAQSSVQPAAEPYSIHEPSAEVERLQRAKRGLDIAIDLSAESILATIMAALSSQSYDTDVIEKPR